MMSWAKRSVSKMEEFDKIVITSVSEAYTSKTCSNLGILREIWAEIKSLGVMSVGFGLIGT